ncbi:MaoC family dehydratase N-terminal domain-containing protein [Psychrobacter sp. I-STPA6b]|uniref:FAS1-like dehydratase domain-containing protein n=1 Tax=Psychrobacter sp. I-STPA6b TaxID=2585718 RepID=UPI001D0C676D|nr:MaoC family dehydratase N-terminal domain-containing protein [Psychrobacter sp. I-STPA6b]
MSNTDNQTTNTPDTQSDVNLNDWVGNTESKQDLICEILVRRMAATLGVPSPKAGEPLPALWHWMFFQPELNAEELGRDGHPQLGGFMPPALGRNRMWAGGSFEFDQPLIVGEPATCDSSIEKVVEKQGSTGSLVFVTVRHDYTQKGQHKFTERQTIVYREPTPPKTESEPSEHADSKEWSQTLTPDATMLFRYSAVTFNGHRIHYDYPYVTDVEGYDNLVIHGPMMATLALHGFINQHSDKAVKTFKYRGVRPVTLGNDIRVEGKVTASGQADVWICNDNGVIQQGQVNFE